MRLALFQPDIPQNVGAAIRLAACFDTPLDIIEPCGFALTAKAVRRSAMDYRAHAEVSQHASWALFCASAERAEGRLVLFTTQAETSLWRIELEATDILLFGAESSGVPPDVHEAASVRAHIPIAAGARSLNVVTAAAIALGEAKRRLAPN